MKFLSLHIFLFHRADTAFRHIRGYGHHCVCSLGGVLGFVGELFVSRELRGILFEEAVVGVVLGVRKRSVVGVLWGA